MNILVVEDEALVALLIQEVIEEAGHACVGPAASVGEGCALIDSCQVDAALLAYGSRTTSSCIRRLGKALLAGMCPPGSISMVLRQKSHSFAQF